MDPGFRGFNEFTNDAKFDGGFIIPNSFGDPVVATENLYGDQCQNSNFLSSTLEIPPDPNYGVFFPASNISPDEGALCDSSGCSQEGETLSGSDESDIFDPVLKYVNQMLMEENMEQNDKILHDPSALRETEKSLYEALGKNYPPAANPAQFYANQNIQTLDSNLFYTGSSFCCSGGSSTSTSTSTSNTADSQWFFDGEECTTPLFQVPGFKNDLPDFAAQSYLQSSFNARNTFTADSNGSLGSSPDSFLAQKLFSDQESILLFNKGLEEASKFLPDSSKLIISIEKNALTVGQNKVDSSVQGITMESGSRNFPSAFRRRKNFEREDKCLEEERSNKQSAVSTEEVELSEMFDKVFLGSDKTEYTPKLVDQNEAAKTLNPNIQSLGSNGVKKQTKKQGKKEEETVDLRALLIRSAQAITSGDFETATESLKRIRQHSSPRGNGSQRLAHYFANGLEARMNGSAADTQNYFTSQVPKKSTAADALQSFEVYFSACPFRKFMILFTTKMILRASEKAKTLHIVDFGVLYGFTWPILIQLLSKRPGGPPKLRITGIELPQGGFRPTERIEKTGRSLASYCDRFGVPFEFNGIASQNWETIQIKDLKINSDEFLAVNSSARFKNLLDDTVEGVSPRDAVLNLIRKMNPDIAVQTSLNGIYNTPFFLSRFREALFHFSALYDMFDNILPRDSIERLNFEKEFYGREIMNIIACEGSERIERPETYKQWQARYNKAGFKQLPLEEELMNDFCAKLKACYSKDFVIDEDSNWMLIGWRGRIVYASCCWVPA